MSITSLTTTIVTNELLSYSWTLETDGLALRTGGVFVDNEHVGDSGIEQKVKIMLMYI